MAALDVVAGGCKVYESDPGPGKRLASTQAFQSLVNNAIATGRPIQHDFGIIFVDDTIVLDDLTKGFGIFGGNVSPRVSNPGSSPETSRLPTIATLDASTTLFRITNTVGTTNGHFLLRGINLKNWDNLVLSNFAGKAIEVVDTEWTTDIQLDHVRISSFEYGLAALDGGGIGNLSITETHIDNCKQWGVYVSQSANAVRIVGGRIANQNLGGPEVDLWTNDNGGGIYLTSPNGGFIAGVNIEGQPTGIRAKGGRGLWIQCYAEALKNAAVVLEEVEGFEIQCLYLADWEGDENQIAILRCQDGTVKHNASSTNVNRVRIFDSKNVNVSPDKLVPYRISHAEATTGVALLTDRNEVTQRESKAKTWLDDQATAINATYAVDATVHPPLSTGDVYKLTATSDNGQLQLGNSTDRAAEAGDWLCGSAWIFIPAGNTNFGQWSIRYEYHRTLGATVDTVNYGLHKDYMVQGQWILMRLLHRVETAEDVNLRIKIGVPTSGEHIFLWRPQSQLYAEYPHLPGDS
jgi:hypothetical protein